MLAKIILGFMIIIVTVGCNLPEKNLQTPTMVVNMATQDKQSTPADVDPVPTYTLESQTPTIVLPVVTLIPPTTEPDNQPNNVFGITLYSFDDAGGLTQAAQAGADWTRGGFIWSNIEPTPGDRFWDENLEQGLIRATSSGVEPIMLIESTPNWAIKEGFSCGAVAEDKFPILGQFAYDLVKRYSVPPFNIHYWELWNEPDVAQILGCWGNPSDTDYYGGKYYGEMLKWVYPQIKQADPNAQVLVGGLLLDCDPNNPPEGKECRSARFLNGIMESGAGPYFDGVSFHSYDYYTGEATYENGNWQSKSSTTGPASIAKARFLRSVLSDYGYGQKFLMNTETAVFWGPNLMDPPCSAPIEEVTNIEAAKVDYVIQSFAVAVAEGWKANVWYSAFGVRCSGLLNSDMSPKAGYYAFQLASQKLGEAQFSRQISEYGGVMGYEYNIPGRKLWVIWSLNNQMQTLILPGFPVEVNRLGEDGLPLRVVSALSLTLESSPLFIEYEQ